MNPEQWLSHISEIATIVTSIGALVVSVFAWRSASRSARNDVVAQVRDWGGNVVDLLTDVALLCAADDDLVDGSAVSKRARDIAYKISGVLERGRFFFPNILPREYGDHKEPAYRGYRPPILDLVLIAHDLTKTISVDTAKRHDLEAVILYVGRAFVSTIQQATGRKAPATLKRYEKFLWGIQVGDLPQEILPLLPMTRNWKVTFSPNVQVRRQRR